MGCCYSMMFCDVGDLRSVIRVTRERVITDEHGNDNR